MQLADIYRPVRDDLDAVEGVLRKSLTGTGDGSMAEVGRYVLEAGGKRMRPALVLLSAGASGGDAARGARQHLVGLAAAAELIHMASLLHDDVVDDARLRHHNPTINTRWGDDVSIALGDYLYSIAFHLISMSDDPGIVQVMSSATVAMCEGQLLQICERTNLNLSRERYVEIVEKKTAALFAASAEVGASLSSRKESLRRALRDYGLSLGISFQIVDDYLDLIGDEKRMGKEPGQDIAAGEATLPMLNLWEILSDEERKATADLLSSHTGADALSIIREKLVSTGAASMTEKAAISYANSARESLSVLTNSTYKESLLGLADFVLERGFGSAGRA